MTDQPSKVEVLRIRSNHVASSYGVLHRHFIRHVAARLMNPDRRPPCSVCGADFEMAANRFRRFISRVRQEPVDATSELANAT